MAFYLQNTPEFLIAWLALQSIGCAPAGVSWGLAGGALVHCLKVAEAHFVLVDEDAECRARFEASRSMIETELNMTILVLDTSLKSHIASFSTAVPDDKHRRNMSGDAPYKLVYTSGTTGMPKACAFSARRFYGSRYIWTGLGMKSKPGPNGACWYNCMPLYHGTGGFLSMIALCGGCTVALGRKFSATQFWNDIRDSEATWFVYVGEVVRYLLNQPPSPRDKDHRLQGMYGNGLRPDVWEKFRERFGVADVVEFFSMSEGQVHVLHLNSGPYNAGAVGHDGLIFRLMHNKLLVPVAIDPETGDLVRDPQTGFAKRQPYEVGGEILAALPKRAAFPGYWKNEEASEKKIVRDVFRKGDMYFRSGDALRRTPDGAWHFIDRLGDTFRWKSENVSTAEVAETLGRFPGVVEANVYGVVVPNHEGRAGCAAIQTADDARFDFAEFARYTRATLPRHAVPVFLRLVKASSHINNHKQNKVPLRQEGVDPTLKGTKVKTGATDQFLYLAPGAETYTEFGQKQWDELLAQRARL